MDLFKANSPFLSGYTSLRSFATRLGSEKTRLFGRALGGILDTCRE
ncbi:hypothetical protein [Algoriphagus jejuensis]